MRRRRTCKCGHVYGSHRLSYDPTIPDDCMSGYPWYKHGKCECTEYRPSGAPRGWTRKVEMDVWSKNEADEAELLLPSELGGVPVDYELPRDEAALIADLRKSGLDGGPEKRVSE